MFDRILVPLDGTQVATNSLIVGDRLAQRWGCELEALLLLRAIDETVGLDDAVRHQVSDLVDDTRLVIRPLQYSVAEDIAAQFDAVPNTLIIMNTDAHVRSAALAENVAEQVMRGIRQPLLLLGQRVEIGEDWPTGRIVVCTDGSDFAQSVGEPAASWARGLGLPLMLVGVIDLSQVPADVPVAAETNALARFASSIQASAPPGSPVEIDYDALHGPDPGDAIVDFAQKQEAAMIVMATHGRSGLQRALYGSVAMDVVRHAACPVLVVRP